MKYKEAYNHATKMVAELSRENEKLKKLLAVALKERMNCSKENLDIIPCDCYECKEEEERDDDEVFKVEGAL